MSTVIFLVAIMSDWAEITRATTAAGKVSGMTTTTGGTVSKVKQHAEEKEEVEVPLAEGTITSKAHGEQEITLQKGEIEIKVKMDLRGRCSVCAKGKGKSEEALTRAAEEFAGKVTQIYVYNKVMNELRAKGMTVAGEEMMDDAAIRINVRNEVD
jgi:hypothetical protein